MDPVKNAEMKEITPQQLVSQLGVGINLGRTLEAPAEGDWSVAANKYFFDDYKDSGFTHVRIPIRWGTHTSEKYPFKIDPLFLKRVEEIVDWSLDKGFVTIINSQKDNWLDDNFTAELPKFMEIWSQ